MNDQEKSELLNEIGNVAAASGLSTNVNLNVANEEELVKRLQPGATDRFLYQKTGFPNPDWLLTIEYNNKNEFTFPQRRIRAENINKFDGNPYKGVVVYNIYGKKYSYSTSVEGLSICCVWVLNCPDVLNSGLLFLYQFVSNCSITNLTSSTSTSTDVLYEYFSRSVRV